MQKLGLSQTLTQTTKLSPAQIQVIRMLELPSIELNQRINEELQENPALEEGRDESPEALNEGYDEFDENYQPDDGFENGRDRDPLQNEDFNYEQYISDDETPSYMLRQQQSPIDEDRRERRQMLRGRLFPFPEQKPRENIEQGHEDIFESNRKHGGLISSQKRVPAPSEYKLLPIVSRPPPFVNRKRGPREGTRGNRDGAGAKTPPEQGDERRTGGDAREDARRGTREKKKPRRSCGFSENIV